MSDPVTISLLELTTTIVTFYVSNNSIPSSELPSLISLVHGKLNELQGGSASTSASTDEQVEAPKPAVNPKKSITEDYIICLEDGQRFKSLKRHLSSQLWLKVWASAESQVRNQLQRIENNGENISLNIKACVR